MQSLEPRTSTMRGQVKVISQPGLSDLKIVYQFVRDTEPGLPYCVIV